MAADEESPPVGEQALHTLFGQLHSGEATSARFCALVDQISTGQLEHPTQDDLAVLRVRPQELHLAGIEIGADGSAACVDTERLEAFHAHKSRSRAEFHAALQRRLEARLDELLRAAPPAAEQLTMTRALEHIGAFHTAHELGGAPLLQGLRALMSAQASRAHRQLWVFDTAALLNGGMPLLGDAVEMLHAAGCALTTPSLLLESGGMRPNERCWALRPGVWTASQARRLAAAVRTRHAVQPTGRIIADASYEGMTADGASGPVLRRDGGLSAWCAVV